LSSNRQARANGRRAEADARAEGLAVKVGSADLLDGPDVDVKVTVPLVRQCPAGTPEEERTSCPTRSGRFRFERKQHERLLEVDGTYHLRLKVAPDKTIHLCDVKASAIDRNFGLKSEGLTLPWTLACPPTATSDDSDTEP
jgi:hypothetical protein